MRLRSDLLGTPRPACRCKTRSNHDFFFYPTGEEKIQKLKTESGCRGRMSRSEGERRSVSAESSITVVDSWCRNGKETKLQKEMGKKGMLCPCVAGEGGATCAKKITLVKNRVESDEEIPPGCIAQAPRSRSEGSLCCWATGRKENNFSKYFHTDSFSQRESHVSITVPERAFGIFLVPRCRNGLQVPFGPP